MTAKPAQIIIEAERSGIEALGALVGVVLDVVDTGVDSDGDSFTVVRHRGHDHLIYDDQCSMVGIGSPAGRRLDDGCMP